MAKGPLAKPDDRRARGNKGKLDMTSFDVQPAKQPPLPADFEWPLETMEWWQTWNTHPLSQTFTESDWSYLLDTAVLHAAIWNKDTMNLQVLGELRLRVAKYGVTPEDRMRLRIQFVDATEKEKQADRRKRQSSADAPTDEERAETPGAGVKSRYRRKNLAALEDPDEKLA